MQLVYVLFIIIQTIFLHKFLIAFFSLQRPIKTKKSKSREKKRETKKYEYPLIFDNRRLVNMLIFVTNLYNLRM